MQAPTQNRINVIEALKYANYKFPKLSLHLRLQSLNVKAPQAIATEIVEAALWRTSNAQVRYGTIRELLS